MNEQKTTVIPLSADVPTAFLRAFIGMVEAHKLGEMARIAAKIVRMLRENASGVTFGYEDMGIILRIVQSTLDAHIQEEKEDKPCTACCKTKVL